MTYFPPDAPEIWSKFQVGSGDVLLLDTETAWKTAVEPRATGAVDMAKQLGRDDGDGLVDDFEELVLSPKRLERRSSCFVDMAKYNLKSMKHRNVKQKL